MINKESTQKTTAGGAAAQSLNKVDYAANILVRILYKKEEY